MALFLERSYSLFLLTSEISMRDGGCLKEVVYGGNSSPEHLWRSFATGLHSFPLRHLVVTVLTLCLLMPGKEFSLISELHCQKMAN